MPEGVALVTGGSRGIGRAIATALAARGWPVAISYLRRDDEAKETVTAIESEGGEGIVVQADVAETADVERMFTEVEDALGPVGALVNNAGQRADGLALSMKDEQWDRVIRTNLYGTFACCRRALRPMLRLRFGRIVNIASIAGLNGSPGQVNYSAAKAGVIGLTKALAREVAAKNITVNAVAPGLVTTELTTSLNDKQWEALEAQIPTGRAGEPKDIAGLVTFLCSEEASYVTGAIVTVDGGMTA